MNISINAIATMWVMFVLITGLSPCLAKQNADKNLANTNHSDTYWKNKLPPDVYAVTRCSATEPPFTGKYWNYHKDGSYTCSNCGAVLFQSKDKFDSGTGWPSFSKAQKGTVKVQQDLSAGMRRDEIICRNCGAHLGHIFNDGPAPTGERFCVNSASLDFKSIRPHK